MKKSSGVLVLLSLGLSLLVACTGGSSGAGGGAGLGISFMPNLPPAVVYDTEQISMQLQVVNNGEADVGGPGDRIYLSGFDQNIVTGIPPGGIAIPSLKGRRYFADPANAATQPLQSEIDYVTFDNVVIRRIPTDRYPVTVLGTACYEYQTDASASVCLDPQPNIATLKPKVCQASQVVMSGGQVAPVQISGIRALARNGVTSFQITVSNGGGGNPFKRGVDYLTRCNPYAERGLAYDELDYVQVLDVRIGDKPLLCSGLQKENHVRLNGGSGQFTCEMPITGNAAYSAPMSVSIGYGYRTQVQTAFQIYHTP